MMLGLRTTISQRRIFGRFISLHIVRLKCGVIIVSIPLATKTGRYILSTAGLVRSVSMCRRVDGGKRQDVVELVQCGVFEQEIETYANRVCRKMPKSAPHHESFPFRITVIDIVVRLHYSGRYATLDSMRKLGQQTIRL